MTSRLTVTLLTCKRKVPEQYAIKTLDSTLEHLILPNTVELAVHIADDTPVLESSRHVESLQTICEQHGVEYVSISESNGAGYGANYNLAMQQVHQVSQYVLPLEDDWVLIKDLDVTPILSVLDTGLAGCVRLGYLGYTQRLDAEFFSYADLHWLKLSQFSAEPHIFAGHPRIETVEWARSVGPWQVGLEPGETEWEVAHRVRARQQVVWPISLTKPEGELFAHIGTVQSI